MEEQNNKEEVQNNVQEDVQSEVQNNVSKKIKNNEKKVNEIIEKEFNPWKIACIFIAILLGIALFTGGFTKSPFAADNSIDGMATSDSGAITLKIINDKRCTQCTEMEPQIVEKLKTMIPDLKVKSIDYSDSEGKKLYDKLGLTNLPSLLFTSDIKKSESYASIQQYLVNKSGMLELQIGANFDPSKEICTNGKDDTGNGKVDCQDDDCKSEWQCMEKKKVPKVELFVMSHCPYGTQMEKGLLPVAKLLGDKADIKIKFVDYSMHGMKELKEELNQLCIQQDYKDKYLDYLECFLGTTAGDASEGEACMQKLGISKTKISSCAKDMDSKYGIMKAYNDKSTWLGNYPSFSVYDADNKKYGVRGSPTFIINGVQAKSGRDSKSILDAICLAFTDKPSECDTEVSSEAPAPGFGWKGTGNSGSTATCG